jgi:outer membrane immunogenic protein
MKKLALALTAVAAFTGSALAADLPARTYTKTPMMAEPVYNWTGFYIFGGAGGGVWDAKTDSSGFAGPNAPFAIRNHRTGGDGWFGTVGAGYDWQFNHSWVAGIFADGQFGSLRGSLEDTIAFAEGQIKMEDSWAAGVRLGYLVAPNVLSYVNAGYTGSHWSGSTLTSLVTAGGGGSLVSTTPSFNRDGWFIGGGVENSLNFFGITAPGWFMKTEYRAAYYGRTTLTETFVPPIPGVVINDTFKPLVQTISTSLVYRFNWGGAPIVSKY